jgi:hypothetical protein
MPVTYSLHFGYPKQTTNDIQYAGYASVKVDDSALCALVEAILTPVRQAQEAGFVACEKCKPGCGQTWFRCPTCDTLHADIAK